MPSPRQRGFTLIELLAVIAIISLLAGLLTVSIGKARQKSIIQTTRANLLLVDAALKTYEGRFGDYPPTCMEDKYQIAGNRVLSGAESLLAHLVSDSNFTGFDFKEDDLTNLDGDSLGNQELMAELQWVFIDTELREYADHWQTPIIYFRAREYGRQYTIIHDDGKKAAAEACRSDLQGWHNPDSYQIWSAGPNRKNDGGQGDDVTLW